MGGLETHLEDLCEYLRKKGHRVFVITYQPLITRAKGSKFEEKENLFIRRVTWFGHNWFYKLLTYPFLEFLYLFPGLFARSLFFLLRNRQKIDVIHAQGLVCGVIGTLLSKLFGKRSVVSTHSIYSFEKSKLMSRFARTIFSSFDRVLCLSEQSKRELVELGIDESRVKVFTYWVDQILFSPRRQESCKAKLGWNKFTVLYVGRFVEEKGIRLLTEVAKIFDRMGHEVRFAFVGDGPLKGEVEKAAQRRRNVLLVGRVENRDLSLFYNAADVTIVPSLHEEGYGRIILESLSCGTPVIGSNRGGIPEALADSVGFLTEPKTREIIRAIERIYNFTPKELKNLRIMCRKYAEKRFSENNAKTIEESYLTREKIARRAR